MDRGKALLVQVTPQFKKHLEQAGVAQLVLHLHSVEPQTNHYFAAGLRNKPMKIPRLGVT
jgi:hypothetical protein